MWEGRLDTDIYARPASEGRRGYCLHDDDETTDGAPGENKEPRDLDLVVLEPPTNTDRIDLEIRVDSKTVEWINGKKKRNTTVEAVGVTQKQLREWWSKCVDLRRRVDDQPVENTTQKLTPRREWESEAELTRGRMTQKLFGLRSLDRVAPTLGLYTIFKKCGPVPDKNCLDAEIAGCSMLVESLTKWRDKCVWDH